MMERSGRPAAFTGILVLLIIVLAFALFLALASGTAGTREQWQFVGNNTTSYMAVDSADTLYSFSNNTVVAIDRDGNLRWSFTFPDGRVCDDIYRPGYLYYNNGTPQIFFSVDKIPIYSVNAGNLYLYVRSAGPSCTMADSHTWRSDASGPPVDTNETIIAISPRGELLWNATLYGPAVAYDDTVIDARDDRIYVFHQYNETVLDHDGHVLFNIADVSDPAAVGPDGMLYVSKCTSYNASGISWYEGADFRTPSGVVEAYYPDGTMCWRYVTSTRLIGINSDRIGTVPVYHDGRLFLPENNGIGVLGSNGSLLWEKTYPDEVNMDLFGMMPFDADGNVYLKDAWNASKFFVIDRDGTEIRRTVAWPEIGRIEAAQDGVLYYLSYLYDRENRTLDRPATMVITARNIVEGRDLWNYTLPVVNATTVVIDDSNVYDYFGGFSCGNDETWVDLLVLSNRVNCTLTVPGMRLEEAPVTVKLWMDDAKVYPGNDVVYASLYTMSCEEPVRFNVSRCVYASTLYALDKNGTLLWSKPLDSVIGPVQVKGNALYYGEGGRISRTETEIAAGIAILAAAWVFVKFFCIGAVSRLKERMPRNQNRLTVFEYIRADPGASLHEICRGTGLNVGTVRYHLWILEANHRIVSRQADRKFVRYFPNSHTYTDEEQLVLSIMKRDVMRRVLGALAERPGLTNRELAGVTGIKESAMSRYMIELAEKGIVGRQSANGRHAYRISGEYVQAVETGMRIAWAEKPS